MFDSMSLSEACADLYDLGLRNNKLQVLYKANRGVAINVKTTSGLTEEATINKIVMQGDTWASTMASVQCDAFGKELLEEELLHSWGGITEEVKAICEEMGLPDATRQYIGRREAKEAMSLHHLVTLKKESQSVIKFIKKDIFTM